MIALKLYQDADNAVVTDQISALLRQRHKSKMVMITISK
jgi:hypothetical protein